MLKRFLFGIWMLLCTTPAFAQALTPACSNPAPSYGVVWTSGQWIACLSSFQAYLGYVPLNIAGGNMTGELYFQTSLTSNAPTNWPLGVAPTSPVNGDVWFTSAGMFYRAGGVTVGPLVGSAGGTSFATSITVGTTYTNQAIISGSATGPSLSTSGGNLTLLPSSTRTVQSGAGFSAFNITNSSAGSDLKGWEASVNSGSTFAIAANNDANSAATTAYAITRGTTYNVASQTWYTSTVAGTPVQGMKLTTTGFEVNGGLGVGAAAGSGGLLVANSVISSANTTGVSFLSGSSASILYAFGPTTSTYNNFFMENCTSNASGCNTFLQNSSSLNTTVGVGSGKTTNLQDDTVKLGSANYTSCGLLETVSNVVTCASAPSGYIAYNDNVTSDTNAATANLYCMNDSSASHTLTLPPSPSNGDYVGYSDCGGNFGVHPLTIAGNGSNIMYNSGNMTVSTPYQGGVLRYSSGQSSWILSPV